MITEYQTNFFDDPENPKKKHQLDDLYTLANKDIRYAQNKLFKVQAEVLKMSEEAFYKEKTSQEIEALELISTMRDSGIIKELQQIASQATFLLEAFQKHQKNRLDKLDDIFEAVENQIEKKRQERATASDEYLKKIANSSYHNEMQRFEYLKNKLISMKKEVQETTEQDIG